MILIDIIMHTPTRSAPERTVLYILINGKMCLQNESIDLFTLKTMHLICRKLGYASLIQEYKLLMLLISLNISSFV